MSQAMPASALQVIRAPGELGPTLRCSGDLCQATAAAVRQELETLARSSHRIILLDISHCSYLDLGEALALFEAFTRRRRTGQRLVVLAGDGLIERVLRARKGDWMVPVFPNEESARRALRDRGFTPSTNEALRTPKSDQIKGAAVLRIS